MHRQRTLPPFSRRMSATCSIRRRPTGSARYRATSNSMSGPLRVSEATSTALPTHRPGRRSSGVAFPASPTSLKAPGSQHRRRTLVGNCKSRRSHTIVFLPLDERFDIGCRHKPYLVAVSLGRPIPVMRSHANFLGQNASWLFGQKRSHRVRASAGLNRTVPSNPTVQTWKPPFAKAVCKSNFFVDMSILVHLEL